ncbi:hypothetical protein [Streptomyces sp. YGL11-2]|uniref:hypothetical protein n=1 Tax=Streptomyces sp. YGL11-2 TaxID=3414028 RepID=UPI003CF87677
MTAHHLLPAGMRELPPPWNDMTWERKPKLEELPHTEANEEAALGALTTALSDLPPTAQCAWSDESWEQFNRFLVEAAHRLEQVMPTTGLLTRENFTDALRGWAETAVPPVPDWWLEEQSDQIARTWTACVLSDWSHDVLRWLKQKPHGQKDIAAAAERCIRVGLSAQDAVTLLKALGAPHGEKALLRVVRDDEVNEADRAWARDWLIDLRRPGYDVRGQESAQGERPLLPPPVQELPYGWGFGFQWPSELPESEENIARARAILEACVPVGPVLEAVPAPAWDGDEGEERPAWLDVRLVMSHLMPFARRVTRERMTEAMQECALLGIPGAPQDPEGEEAERFVRRWVAWIGGWIAGEVFTWLGMYVDDQARITPWAMELAEQYARNGVAAEQAVGMLRWHDTAPRSRKALARIAADDSLPSEVRQSARDALGEEP